MTAQQPEPGISFFVERFGPFGDVLASKGYTIIPNELKETITKMGLTTTEVAVWEEVCKYQHNHHNPYVSIETIAASINKCTRTIERAIKRFKAYGLLTRRWTHRDGRAVKEWDFKQLYERAMSYKEICTQNIPPDDPRYQELAKYYPYVERAERKERLRQQREGDQPNIANSPFLQSLLADATKRHYGQDEDSENNGQIDIRSDIFSDKISDKLCDRMSEENENKEDLSTMDDSRFSKDQTQNEGLNDCSPTSLESEQAEEFITESSYSHMGNDYMNQDSVTEETSIEPTSPKPINAQPSNNAALFNLHNPEPSLPEENRKNRSEQREQHSMQPGRGATGNTRTERNSGVEQAGSARDQRAPGQQAKQGMSSLGDAMRAMKQGMERARAGKDEALNAQAAQMSEQIRASQAAQQGQGRRFDPRTLPSMEQARAKEQTESNAIRFARQQFKRDIEQMKNPVLPKGLESYVKDHSDRFNDEAPASTRTRIAKYYVAMHQCGITQDEFIAFMEEARTRTHPRNIKARTKDGRPKYIVYFLACMEYLAETTRLHYEFGYLPQ